MRLSYAQVVLLCHAGGINSDRMQARLKVDDNRRSQGLVPSAGTDDTPVDEVLFEGKPIDQLNSADYMRYLNS